MADETLIPPPSIGASQDSGSKAAKKAAGLSSTAKLWLLILACVIVGVSLGVVVYKQSVTPKSTPKPSAKPATSPTIPQVSEVKPKANTITFPKAGKVRVYLRILTGSTNTWKQMYVNMSNSSGSLDFVIPAGSGTDGMSYKDTDWQVNAQDTYNFTVSLDSTGSKKLAGFIPASGAKCGGVNNFGTADITKYLNFVTGQVANQPIVSTQCWRDETANEFDFNDYLIIWTYTPENVAVSPNPSPSPSVKASASPKASPSPSVKASPSPSIKASPSPSVKASPTPSVKASPSPSIKASPSPSVMASPSPSVKASASVAASAVPSPSPSIRAAAPTASELPEAGVFEVTAGTVGIGAVLIILGLLGLLIL